MLTILPILVNAIGWNGYIYVRYGDRESNIGWANGACHIGHGEAYGHDFDRLLADLLGEPGTLQHHSLIKTKPLEVLVETRLEPLNLFTWSLPELSLSGDVWSPSDYHGADWPWIIIPLLITFRIVLLVRRLRASRPRPAIL